MDLQRLALENDANLTTAVLVQQQKLSPPTPFADANDVKDEEDVERTNSCYSENLQQNQLSFFTRIEAVLNLDVL